MSVEVITKETVLDGSENYVVTESQEFPIVIEQGRRYIGVEEDGSYTIFEEGMVRNLNNPTACVMKPDVEGRGVRGFDGGIRLDLQELQKPFENVISAFVTENSLIHGDTSSIKS